MSGNSKKSAFPSDVAIIGMAARLPGAKSIGEFWENLRAGRESITFFTDEEVLRSGVSPTMLNNDHFVRAGGILDDIELFDASFFSYSPAEAMLMDPQHRLFLECAYEAFEHAGYDPFRYKRPVGVYAGSSFSTYFLLNLLPNFDYYADSSRILIGNEKEFLPTRVSYQLNLQGPSFSMQAGCSTALFVIHVACQSLLNGECDLALAGGASIKTPQKTGFLHHDGGVWSADGHCRAFDARGTGAVPGNGVGVLVLKRLEDALDDNDTIHALIKGSAITNDGKAKASFTAPSVRGEARTIADALAMADVHPETITYVEAHGTATPVGDPIEVAALTQVFQAHTRKKQFCALGSVKTNIGHLDTAAGVAGVIKTALALEHKELPPCLHFAQPNPQIDFANSPFYVNTKLVPWRVHDMPRRAGVSSYGVGGTNAHVVMEEAPVCADTGPSRSSQLLLLSAKTATALEAMTGRLAEHLCAHPEITLADAAYTLQVGRQNLPYRRMVVCQSNQDALQALRERDGERLLTARVEREMQQRSLAFLFPGQGSQYVSMARGLYVEEPVFRKQVDECVASLRERHSMDILALLYPEPDQEELAQQRINQMRYSQVLLFVVEYALARLWMSWGIHPQVMLGHSLGEYVAACLAGVFSLEEALALVVARGELMQQQPGGSMLAVALPEQIVNLLLEGSALCLAAVNGPSQCTVSGPGEEIEVLQARLGKQGIECRRLHVSHAAHSSMMDTMLERFVARVKQVQLQAPQIPYISNVTGKLITAAEATDAAYWGRHLRGTVRFFEGLSEVLSDAPQVLLEVGPGRTLSSLARLHPAWGAQHIALTTLRHPHASQSDVAFLLHTLGSLWLVGISLDWDSFYAQERRRRIPLPTYPFERQRYWIDPPAREQQDRPSEQTPPPEQKHSEGTHLPEERQPETAPVSPAKEAAPIMKLGERPNMLNSYTPPRSETEQKMVKIWQRFLGIGQIGIHDNFFELGGHSMMGVQINTELRNVFAVNIPLRTLLVEAPTIAKIAKIVDELLAEQGSTPTDGAVHVG